MKTLIRTTALGCAFGLGLAGLAHAASFTEVDADANGKVTPQEFAQAFPDAGEVAWLRTDVNADGEVTEDEFQAAVDEGVIGES